jgi:hypothetical protein
MSEKDYSLTSLNPNYILPVFPSDVIGQSTFLRQRVMESLYKMKRDHKEQWNRQTKPDYTLYPVADLFGYSIEVINMIRKELENESWFTRVLKDDKKDKYILAVARVDILSSKRRY